MVNNKVFTQRLEKILKEYELSAATFADKIQVGRATISHILSGRNKPSLDFVMKIIHTFPQVDLYWLLEGKGNFPTTKEKHHFSPTTHLKEQNIKTTKKVSQDKVDTNFIVNSLTKTITNKKIKRIVLFMDDGTFENYETS